MTISPILLYAFDSEVLVKHEKVRSIVEPYLTTDFVPIISTQVLHEFSHQMIRRGYSASQIEDIVAQTMEYAWPFMQSESRAVNASSGQLFQISR